LVGFVANQPLIFKIKNRTFISKKNPLISRGFNILK